MACISCIPLLPLARRAACPHPGASAAYCALRHIQRLNQLETLLYGLYMPLYTICITILYTRKRPQFVFHLIIITVLFFLCSAHVGLLLYTFASRTQKARGSSEAASIVVFVVSKCVLLLFVCSLQS